MPENKNTAKLPKSGAAVITGMCCLMCAVCALGFGGMVMSVITAAMLSAVMILFSPFLAIAPAVFSVLPVFIGASYANCAIAAGSVIGAVLIFAVFRRRGGLSLAAAVCGAGFLAASTAAVIFALRADTGSIVQGLYSVRDGIKASMMQMLESASSVYGGEVPISDADIDTVINGFAMSLPGAALFMYQLLGLAASYITSAVIRACGAGDVFEDGRWRCRDSVHMCAAYIICQILYGLSGLLSSDLFYYISFNALLAFLPGALCTGVRTVFTPRGSFLPRPMRTAVLVLAAVSLCISPIAALLVIAFAGSAAVCSDKVKEYIQNKNSDFKG